MLYSGCGLTMQDIDYINKVSQIDVNAKYKLGLEYDMKLLVVTDRLFGCADGLAQCLKCYSDIKVFQINGCFNLKYVPIIPDFIIFVGYLNNKCGYKLIDYYKKMNTNLQSILYGRIDGCIKSEQYSYGIDKVFNRERPVIELIDFLNEMLRIILDEQKSVELNVVAIYVALKYIPRRFIDILSFIYYHDCSLADTACLMNISIRKIYKTRDASLQILHDNLSNPDILNDKSLLRMALEKYETEEADIIGKSFVGFEPVKLNIEVSYQNLLRYLKKHRFEMLIYRNKYLFYRSYEIITERLESKWAERSENFGKYNNSYYKY